MSWEDIEARRELKASPVSSEAEDRLDSIFVACFSTPAGQQVIDYLVATTINRISGPEFSDSALRHLEGQRFAVAGISSRIQRGKAKQEANHD